MTALLLLLAVLWSPAFAFFRVVTPTSDSPTDIQYELALFGRPTYGAGLVAPLVAAPSNNRDGCEPYDTANFHASLSTVGIAATGADGVDIEPFVLLVQRGQCHFVEKARLAQAVGASALVVYDTGDDNAKLPALADDGTGGDIRIPSLLVHRGDGMKLMELLSAGLKTIVAINWDVPHPDDRVEVSLWFSSRVSPALQTFIDNFRPVVEALGDSILFMPRYDVHAASAWGCSRGNGDARSTHCSQLCVLDEEFCTYDPEKDSTIGLDGKDVLNEDVRQLCIYNQTTSASGNSSLFWEYLVRFNAKCSISEATSQHFNKECSESVQRDLGLPVSTIAVCAENAETAKTMLQSQVDALRRFHVIKFPEFTVNDVPMYGSIGCDTPISLATCSPLEMICAGFAEGKAPKACRRDFWESESQCIAPKENDECDTCSLRGSAEWNAQCAGCDGVPHSGKKTDKCGVCGGNGSFDMCGRCLPKNDPTRDRSCLDCKGVPNGISQRDACGVCDGHGSFDACGLCLDATDPRRQNFACHVIEDPDAVKAKVEIRGIGMKQFHGNMVHSFQGAVGFVADVRPDQVLVKTVDETREPTKAATILFFVACETEQCQTSVTKKLHDPSTNLAMMMKMKSALDEMEYGSEVSKMIEHISLHATTGISASTLSERNSDTDFTRWVGVGIACAMTLAVGVLLMRVRDDRIRRDFRDLFSRYTPLTTMDYEEDDEYGRRPPPGAEAW